MNDVLEQLVVKLETSWNQTDAALKEAYDDFCEAHKGETFDIGRGYKIHAETQFLSGRTRHEQQACIWGRSWYMDENHKDAQKFAQALEARLQNTVGEIQSIEESGTEQSLVSYIVTGSRGRAKMSQIYAGGYNIIRLHIRHIIRTF